MARIAPDQGADPVTVGIDLGYIKTILLHAAAVYRIVLSVEPVAPRPARRSHASTSVNVIRKRVAAKAHQFIQML